MATFDTVILGEHEKIRTLWREVKEKNNAEAANSLITQICVHFGMEAMVVYPEIRKRVPDGDQLARKLLQQHLLIENRLAELQQQRQQLPTTEEDSQWAILEEVIPKLYEMMEDFENNVLPPLKRALSEERQRELASRLEQSRNKVPHRPHVLLHFLLFHSRSFPKLFSFVPLLNVLSCLVRITTAPHGQGAAERQAGQRDGRPRRPHASRAPSPTSPEGSRRGASLLPLHFLKKSALVVPNQPPTKKSVLSCPVLVYAHL